MRQLILVLLGEAVTLHVQYFVLTLCFRTTLCRLKWPGGKGTGNKLREVKRMECLAVWTAATMCYAGLRVSHARHTQPSGTDPVGLHPRMFSTFWLVFHRRRTVSFALNNEWNALWWRLCFKTGCSPFTNISRFSSYANFSLPLNMLLNATCILKYRIESLHPSGCSVAAVMCGDTIKVAL